MFGEVVRSYQVVIQEEKDGKEEVFENISHSHMLDYFSKHHDTAYRFKS